MGTFAHATALSKSRIGANGYFKDFWFGNLEGNLSTRYNTDQCAKSRHAINSTAFQRNNNRTAYVNWMLEHKQAINSWYKNPAFVRDESIAVHAPSIREAITLEKTGFVAMYSPFDMGWRQRQRERLEAQKLRVGGTFQPPSATDAKATVGVNYYLNSPDAETIEAERRYIQEKAARNMQAFHRKLRAQQHND